jgi:ATP-binding cassette subfamily B protein
MKNQLLELIKEFFSENKLLILSSMGLSIFYSFIESIFIPLLVANTFNDLSDFKKFKYNLQKLVLVWIIIKICFMLSNLLKKKLEPELSEFITVKLVKAVFNKYERENELTNITILLNKIQTIKINFQQFLYILSTIFIPRIIVLFISCYRFFLINKVLGTCLILCVLFQGFFTLNKISECIIKSFNETENKDVVNQYIEDIFYNIDTVQTAPRGFEDEIENIKKKAKYSKEIETETINCLNRKQNIGYVYSIIFFGLMVLLIYKLHTNNTLSNQEVTKIFMLLTGFFDNAYEITYLIPDVVTRFGILKNNDNFLRQLLVKDSNTFKGDSNLQLNPSNFGLTFFNVSFSYDDKKQLLQNFNLQLEENKIYCIMGASGSGKTSFIKIIFGVNKINNGKILLGDKNIADYSLKHIRKYISYIPQNSSSLMNKTFYENIIYGYESEDNIYLKNKIKNIFTTFELYDIFKNLDEGKEKWSFFDMNVGKLGKLLSGGQKQIIHLLRLELNDNSRIVILDEPSSALDNSTRNKIFNYIKYINSKNKMIIIITHDKAYGDICYKTLNFEVSKNPRLS